MRLADIKGVFEHSPWVAERAWQDAPFRSADELHREMMAVVRKASSDEQLALIRAHPELAGREAAEGSLTIDSSSEQSRLGFTRLTRDELEKMKQLNRAYREKFGFPCIVALRLHASRDSVMQEIERRTANDRETEVRNALEQIGHITRGRLEKLNLRFTS
jgi:2-oxo-4-hydroxy-4-carboxy-5-ureidoimidazoline decarboxylase